MTGVGVINKNIAKNSESPFANNHALIRNTLVTSDATCQPTVNVATIDAALDVVSKETPVLYAENQRITVILLTDWAFVK